MSITENVKKKQKTNTKKNHTILHPAAPSPVGGHFDTVQILPNQQEGTETGKESIWINQSIYKCTKNIYVI